MNDQHLVSLVEQYFNKVPMSFFDLHYGKDISDKTLKNLQKIFANHNPLKEQPLLLLDESLTGSAKQSIFVTTEHVFYRLYAKRGVSNNVSGQFKLEDIQEMKIIRPKSRIGADFYINGNRIGLMLGFSPNHYSTQKAAPHERAARGQPKVSRSL